jgi:hypothetical protein
MGVVAEIAQSKLEEARWAVVISATEDAALLRALWPLIEHRMEQMGGKAPAVTFREGESAGAWLGRHSDGLKQTLKESWGKIPPVLLYRPGERANAWLARHGVSQGPVEPRRGVPFYLMLVGRPGPLVENDDTAIPLSFQYELDIFWGVGRICFTTEDGTHDLAAYRNYAERLAYREESWAYTPQDRRGALYFATRHEADPTTRYTADLLAGSLIAWHQNPQHIPGRHGVPLRSLIGAEATRAALLDALGAPEPPGLLFVAAHGLGFRSGHSLQFRHQGAIICQDWSGGPVGREQYLAGEDLSTSLDLMGMVAVLHASYSGACPDYDDSVFDDDRGRPRIAPRAFCTRLMQNLLCAGAGMVLAMVDRAWSYSFSNGQATRQSQPLEDVIGRLMQGRLPGDATDLFNIIQGARAQALVEELENIKFGKQVNPSELATLWAARNDARVYALFGDPAAMPPWKAVDLRDRQATYNET